MLYYFILIPFLGENGLKQKAEQRNAPEHTFHNSWSLFIVIIILNTLLCKKQIIIITCAFYNECSRIKEDPLLGTQIISLSLCPPFPRKKILKRRTRKNIFTIILFHEEKKLFDVVFLPFLQYFFYILCVSNFVLFAVHDILHTNNQQKKITRNDAILFCLFRSYLKYLKNYQENIFLDFSRFFSGRGNKTLNARLNGCTNSNVWDHIDIT